MNAVHADAVHAFFKQAISLRERLEAAEPVHLPDEKRKFDDLLSAFDGSGPIEASADLDFDFSEQGSADERLGLTSGTIRMALTCWLD